MSMSAEGLLQVSFFYLGPRRIRAISSVADMLRAFMRHEMSLSILRVSVASLY